jgi:TIR domain
MSPEYLASNWAQEEFRVAQCQAAVERRSRIITILYKDIGDINKLDKDIRNYVKFNTYVKWGDNLFWDKLKYAMPHQEVPASAHNTDNIILTFLRKLDSCMKKIKNTKAKTLTAEQVELKSPNTVVNINLKK